MTSSSTTGKQDKDYSSILRQAFETTLNSKYQNFVQKSLLYCGDTGIEKEYCKANKDVVKYDKSVMR